MSMKILVVTVMVIFSVFMSAVFVVGFLDKQQKEAAVANQANSTQNQSNSTSQSSGSDNSSSNSNNTSQTSKTFTTADVAAHNKPSDCYLIIHGTVYNVTNFLDQHPGGTDVILPYCGKDATQAFETQGGRRGTHSQSARSLLAQYQIGVLQ